MCKEWRDKLVEAAAEADDKLMEKYLEAASSPNEEIRRGLRARTLANEIVPVLCGSAFKNKGVQALLDAVIEYLPSPWIRRRSKASLEDDDARPSARRGTTSPSRRSRSRS